VLATIESWKPRAALRAFPRGGAAILLVLLAAAFFLFVGRASAPIILWDESRNVVNALEMKRSGLGLVTTYGFAPDLWNTKPPLLIWLMTASVSLFGASEWALRLPSALAALATVLIVMLFTRRVTGSAATAALAGAMLTLSPGFFGEHGARTADYDALLVFFVTAYLQLLFFAVHRERPGLKLSLLIGALVACAVLTKSSAGLAPGVGVALYLLATRRWRRVVRTGRFAVMAAVAAAPVLLFAIAREAMAPGYLDAALHNDLLGRFQHSLIARDDPSWFYVQPIVSGWFFGGPFLLALPLVWRAVTGKTRCALLYSLCTAGAFLLVASLTSTKLLHYALPAFPALAVAAAIALRAIFSRGVVGPWHIGSRAFPAAVALVSIVLLGQMTWRSAEWRYRIFPERQNYAQASYGALFASLAAHGIAKATAWDDGFDLEGKPHYVPLLRSYQLIWQDRGLGVRHHAGPAPATGAVLASCDPAVTPALLRRGADISGVAGCAAIRSR
jgi:4-amino-4-deoxy-L-arabinose transferase-like glycosyltransferase